MYSYPSSPHSLMISCFNCFADREISRINISLVILSSSSSWWSGICLLFNVVTFHFRSRCHSGQCSRYSLLTNEFENGDQCNGAKYDQSGICQVPATVHAYDDDAKYQKVDYNNVQAYTVLRGSFGKEFFKYSRNYDPNGGKNGQPIHVCRSQILSVTAFKTDN